MNYKDGFEKLEEHIINKLEVAIRQITLQIAEDASDIITQNKAIGYKRQLYREIRNNVYRETARIIGIVGVGRNVPYAIFRHEGTRPHFPPIEPIQKWVIYKGLVRKNNKPTTVRALAKDKKGFDESKQIAFAIARKIAKKGTAGLPFLKLALEQNREFIRQKLSEINV